MKIGLKNCVILIFFPLLLNCCIDDSEETVLLNNLPSFNDILLKGVFHVKLEQSTEYSVKIVGNRDFIEAVECNITDTTLTITSDTKMMWLNPGDDEITLYISSNQLRKVTAKNTCLIETLNPIVSDKFEIILMDKLNTANIELNCNKFYYWNMVPCGGLLTLRGSTRELIIWNFALMSVDANNLTADYAFVENHSKGDCKVFVKERLDYSIYGEGDIYLSGDPDQINLIERTSSGRLIH